ncbi:hypothetical protein [Flavobacterium olei]|uniref:hypothetical protein n=1 Tax=Flavobacterium olei TaxID=1886782 RepID=UPI003219895C
MRSVFSFLIILTLLAGCKTSEGTKSPRQTVEAYLNACNRFDSEAAKELLILNKENLMVLETLKKMEKSLPDNRKSSFINKEKNAVYTEKEITDLTARIIVSEQQAALPFEFNLKKTNGIWLIESIKEL